MTPRRTEPSAYLAPTKGQPRLSYVPAASTDIASTFAGWRRDRPILLGARFGTLRVIEDAGVEKQKQRWKVACDCGAVLTVRANSLLTGNTKSCGPCRRRHFTHGHTRGGESRTYRIWKDMNARGRGQISGALYANRGITVCARWSKFENFLADMGEAPAGKSIDRIDNDRGYEPANCRWATAQEQGRNTRATRWLEANGRRMCLKDWAAELGVDPATIHRRLKSGRSFESVVADFAKAVMRDEALAAEPLVGVVPITRKAKR